MILTEEEAKRIANAIAFGHAGWKHATNIAEVGELLTPSSFESLILETLLNPQKFRQLKMGRLAFWNENEGLLVIYNPNDSEQGTAYWPRIGVNELKKLG